jgi:hypothetical protein
MVRYVLREAYAELKIDEVKLLFAYSTQDRWQQA